MPLVELWELTPAQAARVLDGRDAARIARMETTRALNFELAGLLKVGFHSPKKMPKYEPLKPRRRRNIENPTLAEIDATRAIFAAWAQRDKPKG